MFSIACKKQTVSLLATVLCFVVISGALCGELPLPAERLLTKSLSYDYMWSPDGNWIIAPTGGGIAGIDLEGRDLFESHVEGDRLIFMEYSQSISIDDRLLYHARELMPSTFRRPPWQLFIRDTHYGVIRTSDLEGNDELELRRIGERDFDHPTWSPDGSRIAFTQQHRGAATYELAIMDADGTDLRIYDQVINPDALVWSPDGSHIAVVEQTRVIKERRSDRFHYDETIDYDRLVVVRLSDGFTQRFNEVEFSNTIRRDLRDDGSISYENKFEYELSGNEVIPGELEWSERDGRIYFLTERYSARHKRNYKETIARELIASTIYSINPDGTDRRTVYQSGAHSEILSFDVSPDGEKIIVLFTHEPSERQDSILHVMNSDGTGIRRLAGRLRWHGRAAWSPDSSKIALSAEFRLGWDYRDPDYGSYLVRDGLFVMNADGTEARLLLHWDSEWDTSLNEESWRFDPNESILVGVDYE